MRDRREGRLRTIVAAVFLGVLAAPGAAQELDARDAALLPEYCRYTALAGVAVNDPPRKEYWASKIGPMFGHLHHYCMGLIATNRSNDFMRPRQERMTQLAHSIKEFDYVIRNSTRDFVLLPEILTKKGENLIRLGHAPQGAIELNRAIEIKPDYWPPYAALSDYYKSSGEIDKAREILDKGLAADPTAKPLERRKAELRTAKANGATARSETAGKKSGKTAPGESKDAGEAAAGKASPEK